MQLRHVTRTLTSRPTIEGAGVHLKRAFGYDQVPLFDPFLMLDDFHSSNPEDYLPGFPWHPHRGIETITYVLEGLVEHGDSMGHTGVIGAGDVQWMTAGSGIIHQEMPKESPTGTMWGFQFWANLPAERKMMAPRYRGITAAEIPEATLDGGVRVKVVAGTVAGVQGPVQGIVIEPEMLDVTVPPQTVFTHAVAPDHTVFAYVLAGSAAFDAARTESGQPAQQYGSETVVLYDRSGDTLQITTCAEPARFLLLAGKPLGEPVAWYGPVVMNTEEELRVAFQEYQDGTFVKK